MLFSKVYGEPPKITQHKQSHKVGRVFDQSQYIIHLPARDLSSQHLKFADGQTRCHIKLVCTYHGSARSSHCQHYSSGSSYANSIATS